MSEIQITEGKQPSEFLSTLIKQAVDNFVDFTTNWIEIIERAKYEGFSEDEIKAIMIPMMKDQFRAMGLDEKQIDNRLQYRFNAQKFKERQKENYKKKFLNIQENDLEPSDWDKASAMDEIARLQTDLNDANETIRSMSFEENPDIFRINKADPNSMVFTKLKGSDCIDIIRNDLKKDSFYDIAWKEAV